MIELYQMSAQLWKRPNVPVLVQLDARDNDVAGVDANWDGGTIRLVAVDTVDVDDPLLTVHLGHLAHSSLVLAPNDPNLVVLSNR